MRDRRPADDEGGEILYGIHPVLEALEGRLRQVERILIGREGTPRALGRILRLARDAGIPVSHLPREVLARKAGAQAVHQGIAALVSAVPYADPDAVCREAVASGEALLVLLDGVTDPRNVGAILRTACATGAHGILLGEGAAGLTPAAAKTSAGAVERIPVAREPHPGRRLDALREAGVRVAALDPRGGEAWDAADLGGPLLLLAGGEGPGLRPGLLRRADARVALPLRGGIESLNVSVAVGVVLYEVLRRRRQDAVFHAKP